MQWCWEGPLIAPMSFEGSVEHGMSMITRFWCWEGDGGRTG